MKEVLFGRINSKGHAKEAETEWHLWVDELIEDKPEYQACYYCVTGAYTQLSILLEVG